MQSLPTYLRRSSLEGRGWHKSKNKSVPLARLLSEPHTTSTINSTNPSEGVFPLESNSRPYLNQHLASRVEEESGPGAPRPMGKLLGLVHFSFAIISHPDYKERSVFYAPASHCFWSCNLVPFNPGMKFLIFFP